MSPSTTLSTPPNSFHTPSSHSAKNLHCHHYHILTGDVNSWVGTEEQKEFLINHSGFRHIPPRLGNPDPRHQYAGVPYPTLKHEGRNPNPDSTTTHARARGRLLLEFLNHCFLILANDWFFEPLPDSTYQNLSKHPPFSPHLPTTIHDTIVNYFIVCKTLVPDISQCTTW